MGPLETWTLAPACGIMQATGRSFTNPVVPRNSTGPRRQHDAAKKGSPGARPRCTRLAKNVSTRQVAVKTVFKSPGPKPNGLQATRDGLWILDQGDNRAYLVDYQDGKVLRALDTDSKAGSGITYDGEAIWIASTYSREIIRARRA